MYLVLIATVLLQSTLSSEITSGSTSTSNLVTSTSSLVPSTSSASPEENEVIRSIEKNITQITLDKDEDRDVKKSSPVGQDSRAGFQDVRWGGGERGNHNLVLGKKQERDELLLRYVCKKDGRWLRTATDEVMWPLYGRKPTNHIIHYVEALDQEPGGRGGFASITRGGVSHKNVTVSLKSQRNYGLNFIVSIYGSPEYHETYEDTIVINEKPDKNGVVQGYRPTASGYQPPNRPSQVYGIDPYVPPSSGYRPQLGYETDHHSNRPNFSPQHGTSGWGAQATGWGSQTSSEESEDGEVVNSGTPGIYIEQHQYKPTYNPYKPAGSYKPGSNLNAEVYLSSKPKPNIYTHNVEAYKPGEYYVHHQQNYYAKPQKYN